MRLWGQNLCSSNVKFLKVFCPQSRIPQSRLSSKSHRDLKAGLGLVNIILIMIKINLLTRRLRSLPFWRRRTQLRSGASATQRQQPGPRPGLRTVYLLASGHCTAHSHLCSHWTLRGPLGRLTLVHVGPECVWGNTSFDCNCYVTDGQPRTVF